MEIKLKVEKMACGGCEKRIENSLSEIDGVEFVKADHVAKVVSLKIKNETILKEIIERIEELGFEVVDK